MNCEQASGVYSWHIPLSEYVTAGRSKQRKSAEPCILSSEQSELFIYAEPERKIERNSQIIKHKATELNLSSSSRKMVA